MNWAMKANITTNSFFTTNPFHVSQISDKSVYAAMNTTVFGATSKFQPEKVILLYIETHLPSFNNLTAIHRIPT